jgi:hypothetical protein
VRLAMVIHFLLTDGLGWLVIPLATGWYR